MQKEVHELRERRSRLAAELESCGSTDAGYVEGLQQAATTAKDGANRWTDNIFVCRSYAEKKLNTDRNQFHEVRAPCFVGLVAILARPVHCVDVLKLHVMLIQGLKQLGIKQPAALDYVQ